MRLKQLVPESICLACDGCCRFGTKDSSWAPVFSYGEIVELTGRNIVPSCLFSRAGITLGRATRITLVEKEGIHFCPCFDREGLSGICKIYAHRPLDCQIYPFLLARKGRLVFLAADLKCPFVKQHITGEEARSYIQYLLEYFAQGEARDLLRDNPELIQEYDQDAMILAPLDVS